MIPETIETLAHTTRDGVLNLSFNVGVPDSDVSVTIHVKPVASSANVDANGWPVGYFEKVVGSMPELERAPQGDFETRLPLE
jgi:hypothetical protein